MNYSKDGVRIVIRPQNNEKVGEPEYARVASKVGADIMKVARGEHLRYEVSSEKDAIIVYSV